MILFQYVAREYLRYVAGITALTVFLFVLFDFLHKTTRYFAKFNPSTSDMVLFYFYQSPALVLQALPIASLLGSVGAMVLLSRSNEITAMRAAGMGPFSIGAPILACGAGLSVLSLLATQYVLPRTARRMHYVESVRIEGKSMMKSRDSVPWGREENTFVSYRAFDPQSSELSGVEVMDVGPSFRPREVLYAQRATYDSQTRQWVLPPSTRLSFSQNSGIQAVETAPEMRLPLPLDPGALKRDPRLPNELSFGELSRLIEAGQRSGANVNEFRLDYHLKIAYPFAVFVVSLIGIRFCFRSERSLETARSLLSAVGVGISYWFVLSTARAIGKRGEMSPVLAAWLPNLVVLLLAVALVWRSSRRD